MKKIIFILITIFSFTSTIYADKIEVELSKCVDGDTARFIIETEEKSVRFLAINTPESTNKKEPFGKEASDFTCNKLRQANKIEIEYDDNSNKTDKYDRVLAWIFVDGELLQELIIKEGLGEVDYLYGDYKYTSNLELAQTTAKLNKVGMWQDINYWYIAIILVVIIIAFIVSKKYRKKLITKGKNTLKKELKKKIK